MTQEKVPKGGAESPLNSQPIYAKLVWVSLLQEYQLHQ